MLLYLVLTSHSEGSVNNFKALARLNGYFVLVQSAVFTNGECDKGCEKRVSCPLTPCLLIKCFLGILWHGVHSINGIQIDEFKNRRERI
jgi:hypothetical protein